MTNGDDMPTEEELADAERFADVVTRLAVAGGRGDIDECQAALDALWTGWGGEGMTHAALTLARAFHEASGMTAFGLDADGPGAFSFTYSVIPLGLDADGNRVDADGNRMTPEQVQAESAALVEQAHTQFAEMRESLSGLSAPDDVSALDGDDVEVVRPLGEEGGITVGSPEALQATVSAMQFIVAVANNDGETGAAIVAVAAPNYGFAFMYSLAQLAGQAWITAEANAENVEQVVSKWAAHRAAPHPDGAGAGERNE